MAYHPSFQPSLAPQSHQQALAPVQSTRRNVAERKPEADSSAAKAKGLTPGGLVHRLGRVDAPANNNALLLALKQTTDTGQIRALRDQLIRKNLPLVYSVTARLGPMLSLPQEDLRQVGSLGLLRAIDAYDPALGRTLSSFAVPYIRGAIQQELRDRASLVRIPRPLWELRRRATVVQDRRRRLGQPQLAPAQLAEVLECPTCQLVEALQIGSVVDMRSLDAPNAGEGGDEASGRTLMEQLADPASLAERHPEGEEPSLEDPLALLLSASSVASGSVEAPAIDAATSSRSDRAFCPPAQHPAGWPCSPERSWLQQRIEALSALERQLLIGHVCLGRTWAEMARELRLPPRRVQRRTVALLSRLEGEARRWREGGGSPGATA